MIMRNKLLLYYGICRAVMFPETQIIISYNDIRKMKKWIEEINIKEIKDQIEAVIDKSSEEEFSIKFKNGSCITRIKPNSKNVRGKRADLYMDDFERCLLNKEVFEETVKPFLVSNEN